MIRISTVNTNRSDQRVETYPWVYASANPTKHLDPTGLCAARAVAGARFDVVRGRGHREGNALALEAMDASGVAIVSSRVPAFAATDFPRVEWMLESAERVPPALTFLWRTREKPDRTFSKPLVWDEGNVGHVAPLQLAGTPGWSGTIVGLALAARGSLSSPLTIGGVVVPGVSSLTSARDVLGEWTRHFAFSGGSITFPFDKERNDHLSLLLATVAAQGLAITAYLTLARRRHNRVDSRVIWTILIAGWLVLDVRWQINLGRELLHTAQRFAGKSGDERHLASDDGQLFTLMQKVNRALPAPPARVFLFSDAYALRTRSAFFLYPHNVYQDRVRAGRPLPPEVMVSGDFALLFPAIGIGYDREKRLLTWADGQSRSADELLESAEGAFLLRIK
jgi:hypothetical protein